MDPSPDCLAPSEHDPLDAVADEFLDRLRHGTQPDLAELAAQHPHLAERILALFPALIEMERAASLAGGAKPGRRWDLPLKRIGDYRIVRELGRGGMGVVYEAVEESLGRRVALKVLPETALTTAQDLERFQREAKAAAKLHHTNIVPLFGVSEEDGIHFFAMQYIEGCNLAQVLEEVRRQRHLAEAAAAQYPPAQSPDHGAAPDAATSKVASISSTTLVSQPEDRYLRGVARLGVQAADGLAHAHAQGVLHRDIKPSNLILDAHETLWITDFGLAKLDNSGNLTGSGDLVGTLRYMAPERFRHELDARSDVYALGATLYEMLTLQPAFEAPDHVLMIRNITEIEPPPPRCLNPRIPRDLETVVLKAMAKDPARRYPSAQALADDLRRFLDDKPIHARRTRWGEAAWLWCRRNPTIACLAAGLLIVLSVGLAFSSWQAVRAMHGWDEAEKAEQLAQSRLNQVLAEKKRADEERDTAAAINTFLQRDLLNQADISQQPFDAEQPRDADIKVRTLVDRAASAIEGKFASQPLVEAGIRQTLANAYYSLGQAALAKPQLERALELRTAVLGAEHSDTLAAQNNLAIVHHQLGDHAKALQLLQEVWRAHKAKYGADHADTLKAQHNLAAVSLAMPIEQVETLVGQAFQPDMADAQRQAGKPDLREALIQDVIARRTAALGEAHLDTVHTRLILARLYARQKRFDKAEELYRDALAKLTAGLGADHPLVLNTQYQLARLCEAREAFGEAEALLGQVLQLRTASLGPGHPDTHAARHALAALHVKQRNYARAESLWTDAIAVQTAKLGAEAPATLSSRHNLAVLYYRTRRLAAAVGLFEEVLGMRRKVLGDDAEATINTAFNLAESYLQAGKTVLALGVMDEWLPRGREKLGFDHATMEFGTITALSLFERTKMPAKAAQLRRDLADFWAKKAGPDDPRSLDHRYKLAVSYWHDRDHAQSIPLFNEVLEGRRRRLGEHSREAIDCAIKLSANYRDAGRLDDALQTIETWMPRALGHLPRSDPLVLQSIQVACGVYALTKAYAKAEPLLRDRALFLKEKSGPESRDYGRGLVDLGDNLLDQGKWADAEPVLRDGLVIRRKFEPDAWTTFDAQVSLGAALLGQKKYADAEPLLLAGYDGMKQRVQKIPARDRNCLTIAVDRLIELYTAQSNADAIGRWQAEKALLSKQPAPMPPHK